MQLATLVLLAVAFSMALRLFQPVGLRVEATPVVEDILLGSSAPQQVPPNADITMVIFTDYQCPACRIANDSMQAVLAEDGRVRVVYRDWPIFGDASRKAARVAIASAKQGIYPQVHDRLMRRTGRLDDTTLRKAVEASGGDWKRLQQDLRASSSAIDALLARNATQAFALGLSGTPGYLIGHILVRGAMDERQFRRALARARKQR